MYHSIGWLKVVNGWLHELFVMGAPIHASDYTYSNRYLANYS